MGKYILYAVIAFLVGILGMMYFPTTHGIISGISTTGFTDLEKAGMAILSYAFLGFVVYIIWGHIKGIKQ